MDKKEYFLKYLELRDRIDDVGQQLESQHKAHMQCRKRCDSCCESISVFPLELDAIMHDIKSESVQLPKERLFNKYRKSCNFLVDSACSIYKYRPIICRTQGFPLLYENAEGNGYALSVCRLNFKNHEPSSFNLDNALFMPPYNSELFLLNREYVKEHYSSILNSKSRIPLYAILKNGLKNI